WEIDLGVLNPIDSTNDFAIASRTLSSAIFGVDHTNNTIYIGNGTINGNTTVTFKAGSTGSSNLQTGDLVYNTADQFQFSGGDVAVDQNLLVGTSPTLAPLSVTGGVGANAAFILNQQNSGDILTASSSGATKFTIANNGN